MNDIFEPGTTVPTSEYFEEHARSRPDNHLYRYWHRDFFEALNGNRSDSERLQPVDFRQPPSLHAAHSRLLETTKAADAAARAHARYEDQYEAWRTGRGRREPKQTPTPDWGEANFWREYQRSRLGPQVFIDTYGRNGTGRLPRRLEDDEEEGNRHLIAFRSLRCDDDVKEVEASAFAGCFRSDPGPATIRRLCYEAYYVSVAAVDFDAGIWGLLLGQRPTDDQFHFTCLWVRPEARRKLVATKLVRRALTAFPGREPSAVARTADEKAYWTTRRKVRLAELS